MRRVLLFIPLIIALVLGGFFWKGLSLNPRDMPSALINKPFPEFQIASLADPQRMVTRSDLIGRPALVNVWATWCPSCKIEHPQLLNIARNEGVKIYGINYKDDRDKAKLWLRQYQDPFALNIFDEEGRLGLDLGVYGAPETYILDAQGIIRYRHAGPIDIATWDKMRDMLKQISQES